MDTALFHGDLVNTSRILYTPSDFAKCSLFHIQEIGSLQAKKPHASRRSYLSSYLLFLVISGSGMLTYKDTAYSLNSGSCVFIDCRHPYSHSTSDDLWHLAWIHFDGPTAADIYRKYLERGGLPAFQPNEFQQYVSHHQRLYEIASSSSYIRDMEINAELASLLSLLMADSWHPEEAVPGTKKTDLIEVRNYLDTNFSKKIVLDDLSEHFHINKFYLTRIFREQFGLSIMDYLLGIRITEAKNLLRFSNRSAEEIGICCGIGDICYFSRVFKRIEGISIREFRKQWK